MADKLEVGSIVEGKVIRVKPFGAIVSIEGAGQGLVHISQISSGFVNDINEHVKSGDTVKVKVLSVDEGSGKISLSMKEAAPKPPRKEKASSNYRGDKETGNNKPNRPQNNKKDFQKESAETASAPSNTFEDKMKEWLKAANEKQAVLNKRINKR